MVRIANALREYCPESVSITDNVESADLIILYVIGSSQIPLAESYLSQGKQIAIVQCCLKTAGGTLSEWINLWRKCAIVWSYYDLTSYAIQEYKRASITSIEYNNYIECVNFYHAPIGIDSIFKQNISKIQDRERYVITTGYVDGTGCEAITDVWKAALSESFRVVHIGGEVARHGEFPEAVVRFEDVTDELLRNLYMGADYVFSLRYHEGFELPAAEAISCGTRPVLFVQPDLIHHYGAIPYYLKECQGKELINEIRIMLSLPRSNCIVPDYLVNQIRFRFDWQAICKGFWASLMRNAREAGNTNFTGTRTEDTANANV